MIAIPINLISKDERGVAYIADTKMKVRQIVIEKNVWGLTPEQIQEGHEHLSLAQIYAALAYYYDHKDVVDGEIRQAQQEIEELQVQHPNPLTRQELSERWQRRQKTSGTS
ncbi:MAG: DUF433 domain-containing protein [Chloroflexi bacterium]|nr:DUF433 domain-containing protein [Chloroflexota bacterium]